MDYILGTKESFARFTDKDTFNKIVDLNTMSEFLAHIKNNYSNLPAIGKPDGSIATYNDLYNDVLRFISYLNKNEIGTRVNIGLVCGNNYNFAVASLACMVRGNVVATLPMQLDEATLFGISYKYDLKAVIFDDALEAKSSVIRAKNLSKVLVSSGINEIDATNLNEKELINNEILPKDPAIIILTGGTTGKSKGALLSHEALICGTINGCYGLKDVFNQVYYCMMPLTHVFGLVRNLLTSLYTGSLIYFNENKMKMFEEFARFKPTELVIVPALAELFLNLVKQYGLGFIGGRVKTIICGAAPVPPYLVEEYDKLGILFCPGYGLTEFANLVSGNPEPLKYPGSVGKIYPYLEAKLVNDELYLRGKNQLISYYKEDEENKIATTDDGWFKTGDLARIDEHGNLYITGRCKEVIVLKNGENVSPSTLEVKFNELSFIQDSLVYLTTNKLGAEILKLEVTLRPLVIKSMGIKEEDVKDYVLNELAKINKTFIEHEQVAEMTIRDSDFARTPAMKIIRPKQEIK